LKIGGEGEGSFAILLRKTMGIPSSSGMTGEKLKIQKKGGPGKRGRLFVEEVAQLP